MTNSTCPCSWNFCINCFHLIIYVQDTLFSWFFVFIFLMEFVIDSYSSRYLEILFQGFCLACNKCNLFDNLKNCCYLLYDILVPPYYFIFFPVKLLCNKIFSIPLTADLQQFFFIFHHASTSNRKQRNFLPVVLY